jgi:hypothetical protein
MIGVVRHLQAVQSLPGADADLRGVEFRTLLGKLEVALFLALELKVCSTLGVRLDQIAGRPDR